MGCGQLYPKLAKNENFITLREDFIMLKKPYPVPEWAAKISIVCMFIGGLALAWSFIGNSTAKAAPAYLVSFIYFLFISIGALFFIAIQHACRAGWSVNIRRLMEAMTAYLPWACLLFLPLIYFGSFLYEWYHPEEVQNDPLLKQKSAYLNIPFFLIRTFVFFAVWTFISRKLLKFSLSQDKDGKALWTDKALRWSVGFLLFFVPSFSLLSVDLLMSLDSHWFSTIFGVYTFAGSFQSALAVMILLTIYFIPQSEKLIRKDHLHDLGKFLMGMTLFWAYIAFSQYMLIWYANLPEETTFFVPRSKEPWMWVSMALIVFKFVVPFICLLPRWVKRNFKTAAALSILILVMQYVDVYWLVYPSVNPQKLQFGFFDISFFLGFAGVFIFSIFKFFSKHSVLPVLDPREHESNTHHVTY